MMEDRSLEGSPVAGAPASAPTPTPASEAPAAPEGPTLADVMDALQGLGSRIAAVEERQVAAGAAPPPPIVEPPLPSHFEHDGAHCPSCGDPAPPPQPRADFMAWWASHMAPAHHASGLRRRLHDGAKPAVQVLDAALELFGRVGHEHA